MWERNRFRSVAWDEWRTDALGVSSRLRGLGVQPGERIGCIFTNSYAGCAAAIGVWLAGGTIVSLPIISRGTTIPLYVDQLRRIVQASGLKLMLLDEAYRSMLEGLGVAGVRIASFESLESKGTADPTLPADEDPVFVQYSSGSTREPRGCVLTALAIARQLDMLADRLQVDPISDQGVTWLPFSHDMGFFGCLMLSFAKGMRLLVSTPQRFLHSPATWFEDCAQLHATITAAPNFALDLATKAVPRLPSNRLNLRECIVGGDRVEAASLSRVASTLASHGLCNQALTPAYGLAEAVLAVTMTPASVAPKVLTVDREALDRGLVEIADRSTRTIDVVSCGPPLPGVSVEVAGNDRVGEVRLRSPASPMVT